MAKRRYGSFDVTYSVEPDVSMPLDARQHVRNKEERLDPESFPTLRSYKGLITASRDEEKLFFLVDHNNPSLEESWKVIGPYDDAEIRRLIDEVDNRITDQTITGGTGISVTKTGDNYIITNTSQGGDGNVLVAEYNVTTAHEIIDYLQSEPFAPVVIKRGNDYYSAILFSQTSNDTVSLRALGSIGGEYHIFNYTVTGNTWTSSTYALQKKLISGTDIKTINGISIIGSGDLEIEDKTIIPIEGSGVRIANYDGNPEYYFASPTTGVDIVTPNKVVATHYIPSGESYTEVTQTKSTVVFGNGISSNITEEGDGNKTITLSVNNAGGDIIDDYMVISKNQNIIITSCGDESNNIFSYNASLVGATADNNRLVEFETNKDKIYIRNTLLPEGVLTAWATSGRGIYYDASSGVISYNDGTTVKTIVKIDDGSAVVPGDVTIVDSGTAPLPVTYTITFNANGGTVSPTSGTTGTDGKLAFLPTPTHATNTFTGWFTQATGGDAVTTSTVFTSDQMIYAQWQAATQGLTVYATVSSITSLDEVSIADGLTEYILNVPAQTEENPVIIEVPSSRNVKLTIWNPLTNQWQESPQKWDVTSTTRDGVAYTRYTENCECGAAATRVRLSDWT